MNKKQVFGAFLRACPEASKNKKTVQKRLLSENFTKWRFSPERQKVNCLFLIIFVVVKILA